MIRNSEKNGSKKIAKPCGYLFSEADPQLSIAANFIKIRSRDQKIGEAIYCIGTTALLLPLKDEKRAKFLATDCQLQESKESLSEEVQKSRVRTTNLKIPKNLSTNLIIVGASRGIANPEINSGFGPGTF